MARKDKPAKASAQGGGKRAIAPFASLLVADIAMRGGNSLLKHAVDRLIGTERPAPADGTKTKSRPLMGRLLGATAVRLATRSVPGAIIVGGGLLAKALHDRRRAARNKSDDKS